MYNFGQRICFTIAFVCVYFLIPCVVINLTNLCAVCPSHQTRHLATQFTGSSDGIERDGGQLVIVVLCNHQGALKPLQETCLWWKLFGSGLTKE